MAGSRRFDRRSERRGGRDEAGFAYLCDFVEEMKANGFTAGRIADHGVVGLTVAPRATR